MEDVRWPAEQLEEYRLEISNRIRNLFWTVSGDYDMEFEPDTEKYDYSKQTVLYEAVKQGAFARYFDQKKLGMYLMKKLHFSAGEDMLLPLAGLCMDAAVNRFIIRERLGTKEIRERAFGELETWFSSIKVLAILALIGTGVVLLAMNAKVGGHNVSLSNLVSYGGFFPKGFNGLLAAFPMVIFAFTGIEMVGLTSGETADPKRDLPQAINTLPIRIGLFYVGSMFVLMCIYPWNQIATNSSPFVQVFSGIGVKIAAGVINFVVLTAALSACNSAIFSTSRTLFVLANSGQASKKLGKSNNRSVPVNALVFSSVILFVIVILNFFLPAAIFEIISGIATVSFVFIWIVLVVCHYKYKKRCKGEQTLFAMPLFPVSNWVTIIFFLAVLILLAFSKSTLMSLLFSLVWFACLGTVYNFFIKGSENEIR